MKSKYPAYAAIFTNVSGVEFFTTSTSGGSAIGNASLTGYYAATKTGLTNCINATLSSLAGSTMSYTINGSTATAPTQTCKFYPNAVTKSGFSVTGWNSLTTKPAATQPDDGELLVITNSSTFTVSASLTGTVAGGLSLYVIPGYLATDGSFYKADQATTLAGQAVSTLSLNQSYAFSTQYSFAKIIPMTFYAQSNPLTSTATGTQQTATVTWNGSAP